MKSYNISVIGKVQKVWFRKYTQERATKLGLIGFVMNKVDGSVYIETTGKEEALKDFINWLETIGSPLSKVDQVSIEIPKKAHQFTGFKIRR